MTQALYDALNGMSPEELWARYRQYPWMNNSGKLVMQGEPEYVKGPGLPSNAKTANLGNMLGGVTTMMPPFKNKPNGVMLNNIFDISTLLKLYNHENQHLTQSKNNLPVGPIISNSTQPTYRQMEEYTNHPGEAQARMAGFRSAMPEQLRSIVHPFSNMHESDFNEVRRSNEEDKLSPKRLAELNKLKALLAEYGNAGIMQDSQELYTNKTASRGLSLDDLLLQLRKRYIPPFLSLDSQ